MVLTDLNWRHLAAGITAGAVSTAALYPLDLVKTRFQVADSRALLSVERYRSLMNAFSTIVRSDGPLALYQGMTPALVGASASWGLYFWFYESAKARRRREQELTGGRLSAWSHMVCGWQAGTITCFFTNPVWLIKTRLQLQQAKHPDAAGNYRGMLDAARRIVMEEGVLALYKGIIPALFLVSHGSIQFAAYEELKKVFGIQERQVSPLQTIALASTSKLVATTATYPFQVTKARLQARGAATVYRSTVDCVRQVWRYEGVQGFFKGIVPNSLRVVPASALTFLVYEQLLSKR